MTMRMDCYESRQKSKENAKRAYFGKYSQLRFYLLAFVNVIFSQKGLNLLGERGIMTLLR